MQDFSQLDQPVAAEAAAPAKTSENAAIKAKLNDAMVAEVAADPTIMDRKNTLCKCIQVEGTLGFGNTGLIQTRAADKEAGVKREVGQTSAIVGYVIKNVGDKAIEVRTEVFTQDPNTKQYVGKETTVSLKPGANMPISRKWLTFLACQVEFGMKLANGTMVGSPKKLINATADQAFSAFHFKFSDASIKVNDVKTDIHDVVTENGETKYVVKKDYVSTFGYLMNETPKATGGRKASGNTADTGDQVAALLRTLARNAQ